MYRAQDPLYLDLLRRGRRRVRVCTLKVVIYLPWLILLFASEEEEEDTTMGSKKIDQHRIIISICFILLLPPLTTVCRLGVYTKIRVSDSANVSKIIKELSAQGPHEATVVTNPMACAWSGH